MKKHDIFISYRREGGYQTADSIYQRLINAGYSAFLDLEQLKAGKFNTKLLEVINGCQDFILVLPPGALDRCSDEDDWVRQEIEHAIKTGKNIIPVMLRGFEWPDKDSLPPLLKELPDYNGISAADHNVFTENIERLKNNFLVSKHGINWRSHKMVITSVIAAIAIIIGIVIFLNLRGNKDYEAICQEISMKMMTEFVKMHSNVAVAKDVSAVWDEYTMDYNSQDGDFLRQELYKSVDFFMSTLHEPEELNLSFNQKKLMYRHSLPVEDIEAVSIVAQMMFDEVHSFGETVKEAAGQSMNKYMDKTVRLTYDFLIASLEADCYAFLQMFSLMPENVFKKVRKHFETLTLLPAIPLDQSAETYEVMQRTAINRLNEIITAMGGSINDAEQNLESMKHKLEIIEGEVEKMEAKTLEMYSLHPEDNMTVMWNKVLGIAALAQEELKIKIEEEQDPDYDASDPLNASLEKWYARVDEWLIQFMKYNSENDQNVDEYINAARAYFKAVAARKQNPLIGLLTLSVAENQTEAIYKTGDIIIEVNGKAIHNFYEFTDILKQQSDSYQLKILRLVNGSLEELVLDHNPSAPSYLNYAHLHQEL